jgi:hypothetical protein
MREATVSLTRLLKTSVKEEKPEKPAPNWRVNDKNFVCKTGRHLCEPGSVTFSAGWFAQGHEVQNLLLLMSLTNLTPTQTEDYNLLASCNLRKQSHLGSSNWMGLSKEVEKFLNLTISLINPPLFQSGLQMLGKLRKNEQTKEIANQWQSIYTGISIISNRTTPAHRDSKGRPEWYDTLISYSDPSTRPRLLIGDLGLDLNYPSGTVVGFCGSIFSHEVKYWGEGDRVCYAHFMREAVRSRLDVAAAGWLQRELYRAGSEDVQD